MSWEAIAPKSSSFEEQVNEHLNIKSKQKNISKELKKLSKRLSIIAKQWKQELNILSTLVSSACNLYPRMKKTNHQTLGILGHFKLLEQRLCAKQMEQWQLIINNLQNRFVHLKSFMNELNSLRDEGFYLIERDITSYDDLFDNSFEELNVSDILLQFENITIQCRNDINQRSQILNQIYNENFKANTLIRWDACNMSIQESFDTVLNIIFPRLPRFINSKLLI